MYPVSALWSRGITSRATEITSVLGSKSLGAVRPASGQLSWASDGRKVTAQLDLTVADSRGTMALPAGPLGWLGQRLVVRSGVSRASYAEMIPCGAYRIDDSGAGPQAWATHRNGKVVRRGGTLSPKALDLLTVLEEDDFVGLEQPTPGATVRAEAIRIVGGRIPVASSWAGVADPVVSSSVTYDTNRLSSLCALAASVNSVVWAGRSGELQFIAQPASSAPAVWTATATRLVEIVLAGNRTGIYNRVIGEGTDANGNAMRSVADVVDGPLRIGFGGPYGVTSYRHNDPLAKTQAALDLSAQTMLANIVSQRTVRARITVPADPCLDPLDVIAVTDPEGRVWKGPVVSCQMPYGPGVMVLEIPVPLSSVL